MEETHHKQILVNFVAIAVFGSPSRKDRISFTILISLYSLEHTMAYYQTAIFFFFFAVLQQCVLTICLFSTEAHGDEAFYHIAASKGAKR